MNHAAYQARDKVMVTVSARKSASCCFIKVGHVSQSGIRPAVRAIEQHNRIAVIQYDVPRLGCHLGVVRCERLRQRADLLKPAVCLGLNSQFPVCQQRFQILDRAVFLPLDGDFRPVDIEGDGLVGCALPFRRLFGRLRLLTGRKQTASQVCPTWWAVFRIRSCPCRQAGSASVWIACDTHLLYHANVSRAYLRYSVKNAAILSNGMTSRLSYRSVWTAPGMSISSLLSPVSLA